MNYYELDMFDNSVHDWFVKVYEEEFHELLWIVMSLNLNFFTVCS